MSSPQLVLYTTDHCTMCTRALDLLLSMPELAGLPLDVEDVVADQALVDRYGERLPVLTWRSANRQPGDELDWPFAAPEVSAWVARVRSRAQSD